MTDFQENARKLDFEGLIISSIITALGLMVALFWRDAVTETINQLIPEHEGLFWKYVTAILVTIIVVIVAYILLRWQELKIRDVLFKKVRNREKV